MRSDRHPPGGDQDQVTFVVNGEEATVPAGGASLLEVLRDHLGVRSAKDGCSPQGQCGCCTVLVDGQPRVSCVTPARRVAGRQITTVEGLDDASRSAWADAFTACGASQCGFCTPGIILRLEGLRTKAEAVGGPDRAQAERALQAHLCRCTGWRTILDACDRYGAAPDEPVESTARDLDAAARRAALEGGGPQRVGAAVALGEGGFADDAAPADALVAVLGDDGWVVGETLAEARELAEKVQGRRTTAPASPPVDLPAGSWLRTLRTSWVEPAYLETDASWCVPGGEPATPLANGGAFGGKRTSIAPRVARELADEHGRAVRVVLSREDTVRLGAKRPPLAPGPTTQGGIARVARTTGLDQVVIPGFAIEAVDVSGPPTSLELRGAVWAELTALRHATLAAVAPVERGDGSFAEAMVGTDGTVHVRVGCGEPLDAVVLRSYCVGAAHMAIGLVTSESIAVDDEGEVLDLTIRSFGIPRAIDTPVIEVEIVETSTEPVNGSDLVFAAVAAAVWRHQDFPPVWPTGIPLRP